MNTTNLIVGLLFAGMGVAISIGIGSAFAQKRRFLSRAIRAQAKVVGYQRKDHVVQDDEGSETTTYWHPVLEIPGAKGAPQRRTSASTADPKRLPVESSVAVLYDPAEPSHVEIATFRGLWGGQMVAAMFAACAFVAALLALAA